MGKEYVRCQDTAFKNFLLGKSFKVLSKRNKGRHLLVNIDGKLVYLVYKRDFFNTFEDKFKSFCDKFPHLKGVGESINEDCLEYCIKAKVQEIYFLHGSGDYSITPRLFYNFIEKFGLKRVQDKGNMYLQEGGRYENIREITCSVPKKLLNEVLI